MERPRFSTLTLFLGSLRMPETSFVPEWRRDHPVALDGNLEESQAGDSKGGTDSTIEAPRVDADCERGPFEQREEIRRIGLESDGESEGRDFKFAKDSSIG